MAAAKSKLTEYRVLVPFSAAFGVVEKGFGDTVKLDPEDERTEALLEAGSIGSDDDYEKAADPATGKFKRNATGALIPKSQQELDDGGNSKLPVEKSLDGPEPEDVPAGPAPTDPTAPPAL